MPSLTELLGNPITSIVKEATSLIGKFVADPQAKIEAETKLSEINSTYQVKLIEADVEWAKAQSEVLQAEIKSDSWMGRNWRPILMLTFTYIIFHSYVLVPVLSIKAVTIPDEMWTLLKIGMGGYIIGRSVEKIAPDIASAIATKKESA